MNTLIQAIDLNQEPTAAALGKQRLLLDQLAALDSLLVALSGGADSTYLAWAAHTSLGERALAVTALSASFSAHDREQVTGFVRSTGMRQEFVETRELEDPRYRANNPDRCYYCKDELFTVLDRIALKRGFSAVAYGINADDTRDFRPGRRAAWQHKTLAPLLDAGLHKPEIRALSRAAGLPTWDRPASACLASRIPYGVEVTPENLRRVEDAEAVLRGLGFRQFRVRLHGELARIEVALEEMPRALASDMAAAMARGLKAAGFAYVTLDLEGYRQGSLNETLKK